MVEFWSNHFNIAIPSGEGWDVKTTDDREVIRAHALGTFADLLQASAKSPAMLRYLDNDVSTAQSLNENYGRELLELHTVGVDAGYTQADVVDSARLMTGYTADIYGTFTYRSSSHYVGPVTVLGFSHANGSAAGGQQVAEQYLSYLAHHPATARHLATKLAIRFVSDTPPSALIDRLAQIYLDNDTAIVPVLQGAVRQRRVRRQHRAEDQAAHRGPDRRRPCRRCPAGARRPRQPEPGLLHAQRPGAGAVQLGTTQRFPGSGVGLALDLRARGPVECPPRDHRRLHHRRDVDARCCHPARRYDTGGQRGVGRRPCPATSRVRLADPQRSAIVAFLDSLSRNVADNIKWRLNETVALVLNSPSGIQR